MKVHITPDPVALGQAAAQQAANILRTTLAQRGEANLILATGASQFEMLKALTSSPDIDWTRVHLFHLDEYMGLPATHPASFRKYLHERFVDQVGQLASVNFVQGDTPDPQAECDRLGALIRQHPIDLAMIGIGENGHLAFNDPPADVETEESFLVVELDAACRQQQLGEGWFPSLEAVPSQAISMSMRQILKSAQLIVSVPDLRKAKAVQGAVEGPITPMCPAAYLQTHANCELYLDEGSASLLRSTT
ncbi:MAG: glucosamine-6-phosphate deaminase [Bacteroidota bacterium]